VRAIGLHADVVVANSRVWQTSCTLVRSGDEAFCIDSPVYPDELELLPAVAEQAGFSVVGLLATHVDWDHVLGRYAFPEAPLGCGETSAARLSAEPGDAARGLRGFDEEHYVERPSPLSLPPPQALPVPGVCEIGGRELQLHVADGHTADGMAIWIDWAGVLVCGDYLSPLEIPMISDGGSVSAYLATLDRLEPLVEGATWVVPGHGQPVEAVRATALLREDRAYLEGLRERGVDAELPLARRTAAQKVTHASNVTQVSA
jgi:glyoxylase-like metal-dependent hydrolase (beta-lactamase superfamily II)